MSLVQHSQLSCVYITEPSFSGIIENQIKSVLHKSRKEKKASLLKCFGLIWAYAFQDDLFAYSESNPVVLMTQVKWDTQKACVVVIIITDFWVLKMVTMRNNMVTEGHFDFDAKILRTIKVKAFSFFGKDIWKIFKNRNKSVMVPCSCGTTN